MCCSQKLSGKEVWMKCSKLSNFWEVHLLIQSYSGPCIFYYIILDELKDPWGHHAIKIPRDDISPSTNIVITTFALLTLLVCLRLKYENQYEDALLTSKFLTDTNSYHCFLSEGSS